MRRITPHVPTRRTTLCKNVTPQKSRAYFRSDLIHFRSKLSLGQAIAEMVESNSHENTSKTLFIFESPQLTEQKSYPLPQTKRLPKTQKNHIESLEIHPDEILFHKEWVSDLEELLESEGRQNLFQPSVAECRIVHEHMENKRWALAEESWQQVMENHSDINLIIIATGLRLFGMQGKVEYVERVWQMMKDNRIIPNDLMWIFRLVGHATDLRMDSAAQILGEMRSKLDLSGSHFTHCFHVMMRGYLKTGKYLKALECFEIMKEVNQKRTPLAISMALLSHINCGTKISQLMKIFDSLKQSEEISTQVYTVMIQNLASKGLIHKSIEYFEEMKSKGLQPDTSLYRAIIHAAGKAGSTTNMMNFFAELKQNFPRQIIPGDFCTIIKYLGDHKQPARAEDVVSDMKHFGFRMKPSAYNALIHVYLMDRNYEKCEQLFQDLCMQFQPNVYSYGEMVLVYTRSKKKDKLEELLQNAKRNQISLAEIKNILGPAMDKEPLLEPSPRRDREVINIGNPFASSEFRILTS